MRQLFVPHTWVALPLCGALTPASAAEPTVEEFLRLSLEELADVKINIASLVDTDSLTVPSSVGLVERRDWERRGAQRTMDALNHLPATLVVPGVFATENVSMRGYARFDDTGIATLWDSTPINDLVFANGLRVAPNIGLGTVDRIQVMHGPGSAVHGTDAFHGVIAFDAFETSTDTREAGGQLAQDGYYAVDARLSTRLYEGARINVAVGGAGQPDQQRQYHYADPATGEARAGERAHKYDVQTVSAKIVSDERQPWSYRVGLYGHRYDAEDFQGVGSAVGRTNDLSGQTSDLVMTRAALTRTWSSERTLELSAYLWQVENDFYTVLQPEVTVLERHALATQDRVGAQVLYKNRLGTATRWGLNLGADQLRLADARINVFSDNGALLSDIVHPADGATRRDVYLAFDGQTAWDDKRWLLYFGGRVDHYSDVGNHFSPRVGLVHKFQPNTALKLLYGHAFRAPTALEFYGSPGALGGNTQLGPETIDTVELSVLRQVAAGSAEVTLFHSIWDDAIVTAANPAPPPPGTKVGVGRNDSSGILGRWSYEPEPWLTQLSGSYVYSENSDTGDRYTLFPRVMLNFGLGYLLTPSNTRVFLHQRFFTGATDVDSTSAGFVSNELDPYWRVDLTAARAVGDNLTVSLEIRNVLDRYNALPSPGNSRGGVPDEGFSIGLGVAYRR